jgi:hypothetical protein
LYSILEVNEKEARRHHNENEVRHHHGEKEARRHHKTVFE